MRGLAVVLTVVFTVSMFASGSHAETTGEERVRVGDLMVEHLWARRGGATTGAVYLVIVNLGETPDRLRAVASPLARKAALHESVVEGGIAKMSAVDGIAVPPGEHVFLQPGGLHIMLMGLSEPLSEGQTIPLRLEFERAGPVEVPVLVRGMGYRGPHGDGQHHGADVHHGDDGDMHHREHPFGGNRK